MRMREGQKVRRNKNLAAGSAHQQHEDTVPGGGAGTWVVHPILSGGHVIEINEH